MLYLTKKIASIKQVIGFPDMIIYGSLDFGSLDILENIKIYIPFKLFLNLICVYIGSTWEVGYYLIKCNNNMLFGTKYIM
jgi:hypothetical protein